MASKAGGSDSLGRISTPSVTSRLSSAMKKVAVPSLPQGPEPEWWTLEERSQEPATLPWLVNSHREALHDRRRPVRSTKEFFPPTDAFLSSAGDNNQRTNLRWIRSTQHVAGRLFASNARIGSTEAAISPNEVLALASSRLRRAEMRVRAHLDIGRRFQEASSIGSVRPLFVSERKRVALYDGERLAAGAEFIVDDAVPLRQELVASNTSAAAGLVSAEDALFMTGAASAPGYITSLPTISLEKGARTSAPLKVSEDRQKPLVLAERMPVVSETEIHERTVFASATSSADVFTAPLPYESAKENVSKLRRSIRDPMVIRKAVLPLVEALADFAFIGMTGAAENISVPDTERLVDFFRRANPSTFLAILAPPIEGARGPYARVPPGMLDEIRDLRGLLPRIGLRYIEDIIASASESGLFNAAAASAVVLAISDPEKLVAASNSEALASPPAQLVGGVDRDTIEQATKRVQASVVRRQPLNEARAALVLKEAAIVAASRNEGTAYLDGIMRGAFARFMRSPEIAPFALASGFYRDAPHLSIPDGTALSGNWLAAYKAFYDFVVNGGELAPLTALLAQKRGPADLCLPAGGAGPPYAYVAPHLVAGMPIDNDCLAAISARAYFLIQHVFIAQEGWEERMHKSAESWLWNILALLEEGPVSISPQEYAALLYDVQVLDLEERDREPAASDPFLSGRAGALVIEEEAGAVTFSERIGRLLFAYSSLFAPVKPRGNLSRYFWENPEPASPRGLWELWNQVAQGSGQEVTEYDGYVSLTPKNAMLGVRNSLPDSSTSPEAHAYHVASQAEHLSVAAFTDSLGAALRASTAKQFLRTTEHLTGPRYTLAAFGYNDPDFDLPGAQWAMDHPDDLADECHAEALNRVAKLVREETQGQREGLDEFLADHGVRVAPKGKGPRIYYGNSVGASDYDEEQEGLIEEFGVFSMSAVRASTAAKAAGRDTPSKDDWHRGLFSDFTSIPKSWRYVRCLYRLVLGKVLLARAGRALATRAVAAAHPPTATPVYWVHTTISPEARSTTASPVCSVSVEMGRVYRGDGTPLADAPSVPVPNYASASEAEIEVKSQPQAVSEPGERVSFKVAEDARGPQEAAFPFNTVVNVRARVFGNFPLAASEVLPVGPLALIRHNAIAAEAPSTHAHFSAPEPSDRLRRFYDAQRAVLSLQTGIRAQELAFFVTAWENLSAPTPGDPSAGPFGLRIRATDRPIVCAEPILVFNSHMNAAASQEPAVPGGAGPGRFRVSFHDPAPPKLPFTPREICTSVALFLNGPAGVATPPQGETTYRVVPANAPSLLGLDGDPYHLPCFAVSVRRVASQAPSQQRQPTPSPETVRRLIRERQQQLPNPEQEKELSGRSRARPRI